MGWAGGSGKRFPTQPLSFEVHAVNDQVIVHDQEQVVTLGPAVEYDSAGIVDLAADRLVAPTDGFLMAEFALLFEPAFFAHTYYELIVGSDWLGPTPLLHHDGPTTVPLGFLGNPSLALPFFSFMSQGQAIQLVASHSNDANADRTLSFAWIRGIWLPG